MIDKRALRDTYCKKEVAIIDIDKAKLFISHRPNNPNSEQYRLSEKLRNTPYNI